MNRRTAASLVVVSAILVLTGCADGASRESTLEADCIRQVAEKAGVDESSVKITERVKNPAGSLDWSGTYPGGQFGCAGAMDSDELFQVLTFDN